MSRHIKKKQLTYNVRYSLIQSTPDNLNLQGKLKKVQVIEGKIM